LERVPKFRKCGKNCLQLLIGEHVAVKKGECLSSNLDGSKFGEIFSGKRVVLGIDDCEAILVKEIAAFGQMSRLVENWNSRHLAEGSKASGEQVLAKHVTFGIVLCAGDFCDKNFTSFDGDIERMFKQFVAFKFFIIGGVEIAAGRDGVRTIDSVDASRLKIEIHVPRSFGSDTGVVCQKEVDGRASSGECVGFKPARNVGHNERI